MNFKKCYAKIENGIMQMPAEVLEILPQGVQLFIRTDIEKGRITIHAKNPTDLPNKWFFEELDAMAQDEDWETYSEPVPPELLRRPRKTEAK
ncbi:hypothetical protein V8J88_24380 [Massilia sp. W12]|uniref:hypothetical protein n=1 Tax=Massilia sp. W12 TaxID=3126507 RepID=UPI0030CF2594